MPLVLSLKDTVPSDWRSGSLAGRIFRPEVDGPSIVHVRVGDRGAALFDISRVFPTMRDLCEQHDPARALRDAAGEFVADLDEVLANTPLSGRDPLRPSMLAPIDLQAIKAAGVTFAASMVERAIEERAHGDPASAQAIRTRISALLGDELKEVKPGSPEALRLKALLVEQDAWSQYLEVGIGPDAEIFTKAQPMAAVGQGAEIGIHPLSTWNNPEPELVLIVSSAGAIVGATIGNDVNLRDFEGRSALLLGRAKDNNASAAIGPFIRFFDDSYSLADARCEELTVAVDGRDGFRIERNCRIAEISRDFVDLVAQLLGGLHQYPDGAALYTGTPFAPVDDRDSAGAGFTHKVGDIVSISSPHLGRLVNVVSHCTECPPWTFGASHLMHNLARRGLI
jgi:fumarylacetoacetate (FAA) hydrolase family protein